MQSPIIDSDTRSGASTPTGHPPSSISTDMYPQPARDQAMESNNRMVKRRRDHETESQSENVSNDGDAGSNEVQPYNVQPYNTRSKVRVVAPSYGDYLQIQVLADENMRLKQELLRIQIDQIKGSKGLHSDDEISLTGDEETFYDAKMDSSSEDLQHQFEKLAETKEHPRRERQDAVKSLQAAQTTYEEELAQLKLKIRELSERNEELEREIQETEKIGSELENVNDDLETEMYVQGVYVLGEAPRPSNIHVLERNFQEKSAQVNSMEDELKRLRSQVDEMEKANLLLGEEKKTSIDKMESKIAELNSNIHEFAKTTELLQMKEAVISNQEAELAELKAQINDLMKINQLLEEEKVADVKSMEIELTKVRSQLESLQKDNDSLQLANEGILMQQVSYEDKLQLVLDSHNDEVHSLVENHRQVVSGFDAERILLQRELDLANETIKSFEFKENTDSRVPQVAGAEHLDNSNDNHTSSLLSARDAELNDLRCLLEAAERKQLADIEEVGSMKSSYVSRIEDLQTQLESEQNRNTELDKNASSLQQSNIRLLAIISGKEEELLELKGLYDEEKKVRQMELSAYRTKVEELASQLAEKDNGIVSARVAHEQEIQRLSFEHREKVAKLEGDCNKLAEDLRASRHRYQQDMIQQQQRFDAERSVFMKSNETVRELKGKLEEKNRTLQSGIRELEEEVRTLRRTNEQEKLQSIEVYANQVNSLTHQHKLEASKYQEDIRTMRTDLENLRETVAEKDESITSLNRARAALELQLADQSAQIASLASKVQIGDVNELTVLRKECDRLWKLIEEKDDDLEKEEAMALRVEMERMKAEAPLAANKANQTMTDMTTGTVQPGTSRGKQRQISPSTLSSAFPLTAARMSNYRVGSSSRNVRFGSVEEVEDHVSQYASSSRVGGQGTSNYMTPSSSSSKSAKIDTSHFGRDRTPPVPPPRTYGKGRGAASSRSSRRAASVDRAEPATPSHSRLDDIDEDYSDDIPPEVSRPQTSSSDPDVAQALLAVAAKIGQMSENLTALPTLLSTPSRRYSTPIRSPFKSPTPTPRPREASRNDFVYKVRRSMNKLLGDIKRDSDITIAFSNGHYITEDENDIVFLKPYWDKLGCEYNIRLSHLFAESVIREYPEFQDNREDVIAYFHQRLKTLKARLTQVIPRHNESEQQRQKRVQAKTLADARINRRNSRRIYGFNRRLKDATERAEIDPSYIPIRDTIAYLGPHGYSSDETDPENPRSYLIRRKLWRNRKLIKTAKMADDLHRATNINGNNLPGAPIGARHRDPCGPISDAPPPANLPVNYYEGIWLADLSITNYTLLEPTSPKPFVGEDSND